MKLKKFIEILRTSEFEIENLYLVRLAKKHEESYNYDRVIIKSLNSFLFSSKKNLFGYRYYIHGTIKLKFHVNYGYYNSCVIQEADIYFNRKEFFKLDGKFKPREKGILFTDFVSLVESEIINRLNKSCRLNKSLNTTISHFFKNHEGELNEKIYIR